MWVGVACLAACVCLHARTWDNRTSVKRSAKKKTIIIIQKVNHCLSSSPPGVSIACTCQSVHASVSESEKKKKACVLLAWWCWCCCC